jgi:hypothetical protein
MYRVAKGVEDRGDFEIDSLMVAPNVSHRQRDVLGERARTVDADPHGVGAHVAPSREAVAAAAAHHVAFSADYVARKKIRYIGAHRLNPADKLVTDRHGYGNRLLRPLVPLINVDIRAAYAGFQDTNEDVVDADLRGSDILEPQAWLAGAFDQSFHHSTIACRLPPCA